MRGYGTTHHTRGWSTAPDGCPVYSKLCEMIGVSRKVGDELLSGEGEQSFPVTSRMV